MAQTGSRDGDLGRLPQSSAVRARQAGGAGEQFAPGSRQLTRVGGACRCRLGGSGAGDDSASQDFFFLVAHTLG